MISLRPLTGRRRGHAHHPGYTRAAATIAATTALVVASTAGLASSATATPAGATAVRTDTIRADTVSQRLALPRPTGPYGVGRETLHLVDHGRPDPWVPEAGARELMASMYYPARAGSGRPAPYLTQAEARLLLEDRGLADIVPAERVSGTRATARGEARPVRGRYPLVVLSPGFGVHRHTLTHLSEEFASRGYVVAAVDHAYESAGTAFPGGRVLICKACEAAEGNGSEVLPRVAEGRGRDVAFLLDRLTGHRPAWPHADLIDRTRIGMAGHSIGGSASAAAMAADPRVRAGVNMDGSLNGGFHAPLPDGSLGGRPFLLLGSEEAHRSGGETWERVWPELNGWKRWLVVTGTAHIDFSDMTVLAEQLDLPDDPQWPLPSRRTVEIMRDYVGAFFELHLRGIPQPLLNGPTPRNPEVEFHEPAPRR